MYKKIIILLFLGTEVISAQKSIGITRALVIGISHYQDADIPDMQMAHRDAELFAAFLRSKQGRSLDPEQVQLITNEQASTARIVSALDWLFDRTGKHDTIILYFAGYLTQEDQIGIIPRTFYYYDTPLHVNNVGSFDLFYQFNQLAKKYKSTYSLFSNLYPMVLTPDLIQDSTIYSKKINKNYSFKQFMFINTVQDQTYKEPFERILQSKISLNHLFLDGILGLADFNHDQIISLNELGNYLKGLSMPKETSPGIFLMAASTFKQKFVHTDVETLNKLSQNNDQLINSILHFDLNARENDRLAKLSDENRLLYQDFIVAIKLGYLVLPKDRNASILLDSLLLQSELKPFYGELRRKLCAALQDEIQQALNAYLNSDSREIVKRRSLNDQYQLYPQYLDLASELLGSQHFMYNSLKAKQFYFEGFNKRIEGQQLKKIELIKEALSIQLQALNLEHEAAYIYNEIGIDYKLLNLAEEAKRNFYVAIDYSPAWSIPFSNMAQLFSETEPAKALRIAKHAIRLSSKNSYAYNVEGMIYLKTKDYIKAEISFVNALKFDPQYSDAYYNLACVKSLQSEFALAKNNLELAIQYGFIDIQHAMVDQDLELFRNQPLWNELVIKYFPDKIKN